MGVFCPSVQRLQVTDLEINEGKMSGNWAKMCQENVRNVRNLAPSRRVDTLYKQWVFSAHAQMLSSEIQIYQKLALSYLTKNV